MQSRQILHIYTPLLVLLLLLIRIQQAIANLIFTVFTFAGAMSIIIGGTSDTKEASAIPVRILATTRLQNTLDSPASMVANIHTTEAIATILMLGKYCELYANTGLAIIYPNMNKDPSIPA